MRKIFITFFMLFLFLLPVQIMAKKIEPGELLSNNYDNYYNEIIIKENSTKVLVDGEKKDFETVFDEDKKTTKNIVSSDENIIDYFETDEYRNIKDNHNNTYTISDPYQTKRILIPALHVPSYGEKEKAEIELANITILQFRTEKETKDTFEKIKKNYPDACFDEVMKQQGFTDRNSVWNDNEPWGQEFMGMDKYRAQVEIGNTEYFRNREVVVAVLDGGFKLNHKMFDGKKIVKPYNILTNNTSYQTSLGHGSFVAGIIADSTPNDIALMPVNIKDNTNSTTSSSAVLLGLDYAINNGADVINLSLGTDTDIKNTYDKIIEAAYNKGILIVASSGNDGGEKVLAPACLDHVIAAGAIDINKNKADFSNYGNNLDFVGPGVNIISPLEGTLYNYTGTSIAAPYISSAAAYVKYQNPNLLWDNYYDKLKSLCVDINAKGWDKYTGWGYPKFNINLMNSTPEFTLSQDSFQYDGIVHIPSHTTVKIGESEIPEKYYDKIIQTNNPVLPGTYNYTIRLKKLFAGEATKTFTIQKPQTADNNTSNMVSNKRDTEFHLKTKKITIKAKAIKKKNKSFKIKYSTKNKHHLKISKVSGNKKITVKKGKIHIKKKLGKGKYKVKIKIKIPETNKYKKYYSKKTIRIIIE